MNFNDQNRPCRRCRFMTLLVNFVSMSVHLRSAKEGPSTMRRTCICRGNEQQSLLLSRVSCSCSSHAEDEYAASRAAKAGPVSFQHSSACPYRFSQQSHKSAPTDGWGNLLLCIIGDGRE